MRGHTLQDREYVHDTFVQEYDGFLAEYEPQDPYGVYNRASKELDDLYFGSEIMPSVQSTFYEMLYLHHVIAMEASLSDRLINIITGDLVHRNGRDNNGNETVIDGPAVEHVKNIVQRLIMRIEDGYSKYKIDRFFQVLGS